MRPNLLARCVLPVLLAVVPGVLAKPAPAPKITVIVDAFGGDAPLQQDWGYAALVEANGKRILFDTGNDAARFAANLRALDIDLASIDFAVVSHRHGDHTDGLRELRRANPRITVYVPDDEYFGGDTPPALYAGTEPSLPTTQRYFGGRPPTSVPHGTPWDGLRFVRVRGVREIAPGIRVAGNAAPDGPFAHLAELSLSIDTPDGQVVVVGCSHPGIERILAAFDAPRRPVALLAGGLHWTPLPRDEIDTLAGTLHDRWQVAAVAPGHCTGETGFLALMRRFGQRYRHAGVGSRVVP